MRRAARLYRQTAGAASSPVDDRSKGRGIRIPSPPDARAHGVSSFRMRNLITDVAGVLVGNSDDARVKSGVTVVLCEDPAVASVHVMGGAPGTRETDLLAPEQSAQTVDALVLSGGSAFGLAAADGVMAGLAALGRGVAVGTARVPIVPAAFLFDLINGGDKAWGDASPY